MPNEERPQDFELIELLIEEVVRTSPSTSAQQKSDFKSFKARFQSYIDQIPSYLHSVGKKGFFPHFFLGSFSTFIDTKIAEKLGVKEIHFRFDDSQILKVAVIQGKIGSIKDASNKVKLFVIRECDSRGKPSIRENFSYRELDEVLGRINFSRNEFVRKARDEGKLDVKLVKITKVEGISVEVENAKLRDDLEDKMSITSYKFEKIQKELWKNPEDDIEKLTNPSAERVKESIKEILTKVSEIHSKYKGEIKEGAQLTHDGSLIYVKGAREAAHHGFMAGALVNFRYRHNLRVYLEQFAGRGYADIVLVPRGKHRSLNAIPIIIELKAETATPDDALEQAKGYARGFQLNTMRVLTISDNVLCVGLNLDFAKGKKLSMYISPPRDRKPAPPTIQKLLEVASNWDERVDTIADIKEKIKQPLERIYHTFPGTPEKGGNYFSRFLLGQLLLADKFVDVDLEKFIFLYNEYPLASSTRSGLQSTERPVTTFMLTKENQEQNKEVFIFHVREGGRGDRSGKRIPIPGDLSKQSKITEVYISLKEGERSDFFEVEEVNRYDTLNNYPEGGNHFDGELKNVPYLDNLKGAFDDALNSQCTERPDDHELKGKYENLLRKAGKVIFSFKTLIKEESNFQGVLHGAFSYYSDSKLQEPLGTRALVLTEFQTGRGKRIDMLVHGIKFAGQASDCMPVVLELKGPRKGVTFENLKKEGEDQLPIYEIGGTYKSLTDGDKVALTAVIFNEKAPNGDSLISIIDPFIEKEISRSSIGSRDSRQVQSLHFNRKQQEVFSQFVSHKFPNVFIKSVKQGLYLPSFEKRGVKINGKCVAITWGLSQALLSQSGKSFLNSLEALSRVYERMAQHMQVSKREEREVFALSKLLDSFERKLDSSTSSLPLNLTHAKDYKTLSDLSNYIAGIRGDFAIHLVTSNHVIAIYRTGNSYAYFDSNVAFISGLKSVDQLIGVVKKRIKSASYKVEEKGLLVEHFDVAKANNLLSSEDKQILAKEIKTERQLLEEQDKELGLIKINGQGLSRVQLYDFGAKINIEGSIPVLINADMKLSSKKFQEYLDKREVSMVAREYLGSLKGSRNVEEVTKVIPFEGSKREIEEAKQVHKPKRSLSELVKGTINYILAAVSLSRSESQLPGEK